jgi:hypothetical protein
MVAHVTYGEGFVGIIRILGIGCFSLPFSSR